MFRSLFAITATLSLLAFGPAATASSDAAAEATSSIVVYRADESVKTRRINFDVHVDKSSVGRLNARDALVASGAPGTYAIRTTDAIDDLMPTEVGDTVCDAQRGCIGDGFQDRVGVADCVRDDVTHRNAVNDAVGYTVAVSAAADRRRGRGVRRPRHPGQRRDPDRNDQRTNHGRQ